MLWEPFTCFTLELAIPGLAGWKVTFTVMVALGGVPSQEPLGGLLLSKAVDVHKHPSGARAAAWQLQGKLTLKSPAPTILWLQQAVHCFCNGAGLVGCATIQPCCSAFP